MVIVSNQISSLGKKVWIGSTLKVMKITAKNNASLMILVQVLSIIHKNRIISANIGSLHSKEMVQQVQITNADSSIIEILLLKQVYVNHVLSTLILIKKMALQPVKVT